MRTQPTPAVLKVCHALEEVIDRHLRAADSLDVGAYEADVEALLIFQLGARHAQGAVTLAREDLSLLPGAFSLARAALECCVRAAWLVDEAEPMRREARWIAHLDGEISALERAARRVESAGQVADSTRRRARSIQEFRDAVASKLTGQGVPLLRQTPDFASMLSSIGGGELYTTYIEASQYTHGGHWATWLYRGRGLGTLKSVGERIVPQQWILPLRMCWLAVGHPGDLVLSRISRGVPTSCAGESAGCVDAAFQTLLSTPVEGSP